MSTIEERGGRRRGVALVAVAAILIGAAPARGACVGDCDGDQAVLVNELVLLVTIAQGERPLAACPSGDADGDGAIGIADLVTAVGQALAGCAAAPTATPTAGPTPTVGPDVGSQVTITNQTDADTTVYIAFGADSAVTQADWAGFCAGSGRSCQFALAAKAIRKLPNPTGRHLDMTITFGAPAGCGVTKAALTVNDPSSVDVYYVSLVDGFSNRIAIVVTSGGHLPIQLGPPRGDAGDEFNFGVYPLGCDACVARCNPPCGISPSDPLVGCDEDCSGCGSNGTDGCKGTSQGSPTVPCDYQGSQIGGGGDDVLVVLMP